jgi:FkbM family methyltransferase
VNVMHKMRTVLVEQRNPLRFVIARLLVKTGLSEHFIIHGAGYRMTFFPTAMSSALWSDVHGRDTDTSFLSGYLRAGDIVIDAGANVGFLTLCASLCVADEGHVHSIEAHPRTAEYLRRNVVLNARQNVTVHAVALGAEAGEIGLSDFDIDDQNRVTDQGGVNVGVVRLDDLLSDVGSVKLLKIDVEGYELEVFRGGRRVLERTDCVYFESWDEHCRRYEWTAADVIDYLRECGFVVLRRNDRVFEPVKRHHSSQQCEDLVAVRNLTDFADRMSEYGFTTAD